MRQPRAGQAGASQRQHRLRCIDADALAHSWCKQFQHAPGAGTNIQQPSGVGFRHQIQDRRLDRESRQVERPHLVPVGALATEAFRGDARAFGEHTGGLPAVGLQDRVVLRQSRDQVTGQCTRCAMRQREPDVGALTATVEQAAVAQQLQVARQARL